MDRTYRFAIKPGKIKQWQSWCGQLNGHAVVSAGFAEVYGSNAAPFTVYENQGVWYTFAICDYPLEPTGDNTLNLEHQKRMQDCLVLS